MDKTRHVLKLALLLLMAGQQLSARTSRPPSFHFLENKGQITDQYGQARPDIDVKIASAGVQVFIGKAQMHYQWMAPFEKQPVPGSRIEVANGLQMDSVRAYRMDVTLLGANPNAPLIKEGKLPYYEKYYLPQSGADGAKVAAYKKVIYKDVYPFIDWVIYIKGDKMEYDFVVHPGGKVSDIRLQYEGSDELKINKDGSFTAVTPFGQVTESVPYSFQEMGDTVSSQFLLNNNVLQFATGNYSGTLTIDPAVVWASYFGGNSFMGESLYDIAVNKSNELYAAGQTSSSGNIATTGAFQTTLKGSSDAFLFKMDNGQNMLWATYYGGQDAEWISSLALDSMGNIFAAGSTSSLSGISTSGSHQQSRGGSSYNMDFFMAKFSPEGSRLFCTYYGGDGNENNAMLEILGSDIYLAGFTKSAHAIATPGAHQPAIANTTFNDGFLAKFDLNGVREWATYYGGEKEDYPMGITGDLNGNVYIFGATESEAGIATAGSHQSVRPGGISDHFLVKFNDKGIRQWGTYFGGPDVEVLSYLTRSLDCDQAGNIYIASSTRSSSGIAMAGSHQGTLAGMTDAYLVKFNGNGEQQWGTYFGGENDEFYVTVACKDSNEIYLSGYTMSTSRIATENAIRSVNLGSGLDGDVFLARFNHKGRNTFGTYYGGKGADRGQTIAYDHLGYVYIGGHTNSDSAIATPGSYQDTYPGSSVLNAFIVKFCFAPNADLLSIEGPDTLCANATATYTVAAVPNADRYIWTLPAAWTGASTTHVIDITHDGTGGMIGVQVVRCADTSEIQYREVFFKPSDPPVITADGFKLGTTIAYNRYQWFLNGEAIPDARDAYYWAKENGDYTVVTEDWNGCMDTSAIYKVTDAGMGSGYPRPLQIRVHPNPFIDKIYIDAPIAIDAAIYSLEGRWLQAQRNVKGIDLRHYSPGIYLIRLMDKDGVHLKTEKVIKGY